jgi:glutamate racemase
MVTALEARANAATKDLIKTFDEVKQLSGLTVGRMVHFIENQAERQHFAAIVRKVHDVTDTVAPGTVDLVIFGDTGTFYQKDVTFEEPETRKKRSWHWIEYAA